MEPGVLFLILIVAAKLIEAIAGAGKRGGKGQGGTGRPPGQRPAGRPGAGQAGTGLPGGRAPGSGRPVGQAGLPSGRSPADDDDLSFRDVEGWDTAEEERSPAGSAAEMLPDDLWAILTGEQRPRPRQAPTPERKPVPAPRAPAPVQQGNRRNPVQARTLPRVETGPRRDQPSRERAGLSMRFPRNRPAPVESYDDVAEAGPERSDLEGVAAEYVPVHQPPEIVSLEVLEFDDEARHRRFHRRLETLKEEDAARRDAARPASHGFRADADLKRAIIMAEILGPPRGLD